MVFQNVLVVLLVGKETLEETELVISDGDSQECQQLDTAIELYLPNARRTRCGWHVAVKGWSRHCPSNKSLDRQYQARYDHLSSYIKRWIFSWRLPHYCETEEEYHVRWLVRLIESHSSYAEAGLRVATNESVDSREEGVIGDS
jgi:hypothetical protein